MFGPNAKALPHGRYFHHREPEYRVLLENTERQFRRTFGVSDEFDVLFMTGSGTCANEAVLKSLRGGIFIQQAEAEFARRLLHLKGSQEHWEKPYPHRGMVHYETGRSALVIEPWGPSDPEGVRFADCISSFPYYDPPENVDVWTTVSSKQLGALPILSVIVVRSSKWKWFKAAEEDYSYLNLARWQEARTHMESPHSPAIPLLYDLCEQLEKFEVQAFRERVELRRRLLISECFHNRQDIIGTGPVLTIRPEAILDRVARKWNLYRSAHGWQLFLYGGLWKDYNSFMVELLESRR